MSPSSKIMRKTAESVSRARYLVPLLLVAGCVSGALPERASAATYYVSPAARDSGDSCNADNGNGSLTNPWASLFYATTKLQPGDTLYMRGGVYRENFSAFGTECSAESSHTIARIAAVAGTATAPVLIRPYQNENVVIDTTPVGYETASQWKRCESGSVCGACSGVSIPNYSRMYYRSINLGSGPRAQVYVDPKLITAGVPSPGQRLHYNSYGVRTDSDFGIACSDLSKLVPGPS